MAAPAPILGIWQFGSVGMLLWGLAAAVPILIHLWSRQKRHQEPWAAMSFLLAALHKSARRIQLEQWLLLAVRTAMLSLFALALADPQFSGKPVNAGASSSPQTQSILVIDGSYSMGFRTGDQSRFERAKDSAKQIVERSGQGSGHMLVLMGEPARAIVSEPSYDREEFLKEIDILQLPHAGASLPAALAEVETILLRASEQLTALGRQSQWRICFITDMQKVTWADASSVDCQARLSRLAGLAALELIDVGSPEAPNLAVSRVMIESIGSDLAVAHSAAQIQAEVQSFAGENRLQQPVELLVDGQRIADLRVDVASRGRASISVMHRFDVPGDHLVEVHLADDDLPLDNRRWLSVAVRDKVRVLCIGGRPPDARSIALALSSHSRSSGRIEITEASESRLLEDDLMRFDCIVLSNVARFSKAEAALLFRYVDGGGGLIVFLGDQIQPGSYNQQFVEEVATQVLPARIEAIAPTFAAGYKLDPLDYRHPIVAPFRGFTQSGLITTPIWKYAQLKPLPGANTALAFENRDPAIVETPIGRGQSILVATAASPDSLDSSIDPPIPWTALSSWPSFPPLIHEMLRLTLAAKDDGRNLIVGEELAGLVHGFPNETNVVVAGPRGISERLTLTSDGADSRWSFGTVLVSGAYTVQRGADVEQFAVNVNPRESDLARLHLDELPDQLQKQTENAFKAATSTHGSVSYFRWPLLAVLMLLIVEPILAWHLGRGRA